MSDKKKFTKKEKDTSRDPVLSSWGGVDVWDCPVDGCAFDSENRDTVVGHMATTHPLPAPSTNPAALLEMQAISASADEILTPEEPAEEDDLKDKGDK